MPNPARRRSRLPAGERSATSAPTDDGRIKPASGRQARDRRRALVALLSIACAAACAPAGDGAEPPLVLAAASTINALEDATRRFESGSGIAVRVSFGPTSTLARQVEEGAPADLLLSASRDWADYVEARVGVTRRTVLVGNRLVIIGPRPRSSVDASPGDPPDPTPAELVEGLAADPRRRAAIADPDAVPAGVYARQALRGLGLWERLQPRLVPTGDVRAALALVARGEVELGFVYASDATSDGRVERLAVVPSEYHEPIEYPLLLLSGAAPEAAQLFDFLASDRGRAPFLDRGFTPPGH